MSEQIYECVICGARKPGDLVSFWWCVEIGGPGPLFAHVAGFACDGPCGIAMDERCENLGLGAKPLPCSLQASGIRYAWTKNRLLHDYIWNDGGRAVRNWARRYESDGVDKDSIGYKRQSLVKWPMARPRCVPLEQAKLIAARKYPR